MDDDADFLRAIAEAPDDVNIRRVYADWLEERGDPRCAYLRAICELTTQTAPRGVYAACPHPVTGSDPVADAARDLSQSEAVAVVVEDSWGYSLEAARRNIELRTSLVTLADQVTHEWEEAVCRPGALVLEEYPREAKLQVISLIRAATEMQLLPVLRLVHALPGSHPSRALPRVILQALTDANAGQLRDQLKSLRGVKVRWIQSGC